MKIAVIIDTWFPVIGGGQINAWEISRRLAQKGQKIEIITRNSGKDNKKSPKNLKIVKLGQSSKPSDNLARLVYLIKAFTYCRRNDFDLLVAHAFLPGLIIRLLMIVKNKPTILVVHGTSIGTNLNNGFKAWLEKFILTNIRYTAQITVSRDFLKINNVNKNIVYIPNGVDSIFLKPVEGVKRSKNDLLFVGRLHPQKNLVNLVKAIKILQNEGKTAKLTIIGTGSQKQQIQDLISKYGLKNLIKLESNKTPLQLVYYYNHATALILPSIYEGQPLTLLEAWASKLPVIVSRTGDNNFLVKEGVNGYFIKDKYSPESIAEAIKRAFADNKLNKIGQNGYNLVKDKCTWENSAISTSDLYEKILNTSIN